ncbi:MAG: RNA 2',3'-cyclic phosphodiesterase [Pseudomonadales bacterium]|nr:RNA 2',3'-cyclic phosphodiesterase [Halieaceae bacterium]MCP5189557.1 RNA 2',3'-cyclic phosphodiesterase [Pseudomonadales bacterium]MCP5204791.1 RNA 2',3'-cyclic phosphodiesterase [Pseudomonadales bacterium]
MRAFFALELPAELVMQVASWRDRQFPASGRPVPPANFHITLAFLGSLPVAALERLETSVDGWLAEHPLCGDTLLLDRLGYWPRPGVYWLGASAWPEGLTQLARKLGRLGSAVGAPRERRSLQPHVTLFRSCDRAPPAPSGLPAFRFAYSHFTLFESQRGRAGMHYRPLRHWQLETAPG